MPDYFSRQKLRDRTTTFYCPNGHGAVYAGETNEQKLKRQLEMQEARTKAEQERAERTRPPAHREQGASSTRLRKRSVAGVCPIS